MQVLSLPAIVAYALVASASSTAQQPVLRVYGPGGPKAPMEECAAAFTQKSGIPVEIVSGPESEWLAIARTDADLYFGGAEYMLTQFALRNPELVDLSTRRSLWIRAIGILVRKGNPEKIRTIADLARDGIQLLEVAGAGQVGAWEDLAGDLIPAIQKNTVVALPNTAAAIEVWRARPEIDAWLNFESWQKRLPDVTDLVRLPTGKRIYRGTPVAIATTTDQRADAAAFIEFLAGEQGHDIFKKWGWE